MLVSEAIRKGRKKLELLQILRLCWRILSFQLWTMLSLTQQVSQLLRVGQTLSYGETDQLARRVATFFQKELKLKPGDR